MDKIIKTFSLAIIFVLFACGENEQMKENGLIQARYKVTFSDAWTGANFKTNYPSNAHFSKLVGATHSSDINFWKEGATSSKGFKVVAETGGTALFVDEIEIAIKNKKAQNVLLGGGIPSTPGTVSFEFGVSKAFPLITLVSMLAPSPDWFLGVHDLSLLKNGEFVQELTKPLIVYDAGTDSGVRFKSPNEETIGGKITKLTCGAQDCDFIDGVNSDTSSSVKFLGTFKFERIE